MIDKQCETQGVFAFNILDDTLRAFLGSFNITPEESETESNIFFHHYTG